MLNVNDTLLASNHTTVNYVAFAKEILNEYNSFYNCYVGKTGGIWRVVDTLFMNDTKCLYENNAAITGGAFSLSNSSLNTSENVYTNNFANKGGVIHMENGATLHDLLGAYV